MMLRRSAVSVRCSCGFTLLELLALGAIIVILCAVVVPVFRTARKSGRIASCKNNLHQFYVGVESYRSDSAGITPPWLSILYPEYLSVPKLYRCPNDRSDGKQGGRPPWLGAACPEAYDTVNCAAREEVKRQRNQEIQDCSYLFAFNHARCSWWKPGPGEAPLWPDRREYSEVANGDGIVSWREVRHAEAKGLVWRGDKVVEDQTQAYGASAPLVHCFWHVGKRTSSLAEPVLNLASGGEFVYESNAEPDGWKRVVNR